MKQKKINEEQLSEIKSIRKNKILDKKQYEAQMVSDLKDQIHQEKLNNIKKREE
jgi:hypothetical protein